MVVSGKNCSGDVKTGKWLCAVCGEGVRSNLVQFRGCSGWIHKHCSGVRSSLSTIRDAFVIKILKERVMKKIYTSGK